MNWILLIIGGFAEVEIERIYVYKIIRAEKSDSYYLKKQWKYLRKQMLIMYG
jgi:hypothetical protein